MRIMDRIAILVALCLLLTGFAAFAEDNAEEPELEAISEDIVSQAVDEAVEELYDLSLPTENALDDYAPESLPDEREVSAATMSEVIIDDTTFPDYGFLLFVSKNYDKNNDGRLSLRERENVTRMTIPKADWVSDLKGLEYFHNLEELVCENNHLKSLDLHQLVHIKSLRLGGNELTELDVSYKSDLTELNCWGNQLQSLDVRYCSALKSLSVNGSPLTSLVLLNNSALCTLSCTGTQITSLDLSCNPVLQSLNTNDSPIGELDISNCLSLTALSLDGCQLSALDLGAHTALKSFSAQKSSLTSVTLGSKPTLETFDCRKSLLNALDVTGCPVLKNLHVSGPLQGLDLTACPALKNIIIDGGGLEALDLSRNAALDSLNVLDTPLKALDLSQNTALVHVHLNKVPLTELTVGEKPGLSYLGCDSPDLASLDISGCPLLLAQDLTRKPEAYPADDTVRWLESSDLFISSKTTLTANGKTLYAPESTAPTSLKLNKSGTVKMTLGKVLKLKTTIKPKDAVTKLKWKSSNKKVAKVNSKGVVTPVKPGTAKITVKTDNGLSASVKVKVTGTVAKKVTLNKSGTIKLKVGKKLKLKATLSPSKAKSVLTWKSSKPEYAKVGSSGIVTPVKAGGTTTITVTTANGKKATVKVKVIK